MYKEGDPRTCMNCDNCIHLGRGTFICDEHEDTVVIIDWLLLYKEACRKWKIKKEY